MKDLVMTWVTDACTLPTVDQPLRQAEFDNVFAESGRSVERPAETAVRVEFEPAATVAARLADLAMRESSCCSFFGFTLGMSEAPAVPGHRGTGGARPGAGRARRAALSRTGSAPDRRAALPTGAAKPRARVR